MVSQRAARSSRTEVTPEIPNPKLQIPNPNPSESLCYLGFGVWDLGFGIDRHNPSVGVVVFEILPPRDPAEDHPLRDPPFVRPDREVDVGDDQADQSDAGHAVSDVNEAPRGIAEKIRIARDRP